MENTRGGGRQARLGRGYTSVSRTWQSATRRAEGTTSHAKAPCTMRAHARKVALTRHERVTHTPRPSHARATLHATSRQRGRATQGHRGRASRSRVGPGPRCAGDIPRADRTMAETGDCAGSPRPRQPSSSRAPEARRPSFRPRAAGTERGTEQERGEAGAATARSRTAAPASHQGRTARGHAPRAGRGLRGVAGGRGAPRPRVGEPGPRQAATARKGMGPCWAATAWPRAPRAGTGSGTPGKGAPRRDAGGGRHAGAAGRRAMAGRPRPRRGGERGSRGRGLPRAGRHAGAGAAPERRGRARPSHARPEQGSRGHATTERHRDTTREGEQGPAGAAAGEKKEGGERRDEGEELTMRGRAPAAVVRRAEQGSWAGRAGEERGTWGGGRG
jgi:hypothetical protein